MSEQIRNQGLQFSLINYTGVIIGALSTLFIYPKNLELYGLYGFLTNSASLLAPLVSLGFGVVLYRYFPHYRNESGQTDSKFYSFIAKGYVFGITFFIVLFFIFRSPITKLFQVNTEQWSKDIIYLLPLTILYVVYELLSHLSTSHRNITIPSLLSNLFKIILPILFLLVVYNLIGRQGFLLSVLGYYVFVCILLYRILSQYENIKIKLDFTSELDRSKEMIQFAMYSVLAGTSAVMALRIDSLMISTQLGAEANGQFNLMHFISNAVFIPALSLLEILTPYISKAGLANKLEEMSKWYRKSVNNMLTITLWVSLCIFFCYDDLIQLLPHREKFYELKLCLGFLLIGRVVDAATGINHHILNFSKYYRFELWLLFGLVLLNIYLNIILIPFMGISGAALATMISVSVFNIVKTWFIYIKLKLQPYDKSLIYHLLLVAISFLIIPIIPDMGSPFFSIIIKSICQSILILFFITQLNLSEDINKYLQQLVHQLKIKIKNKSPE